MPAQQSLKSFFKPLQGVKRPLSDSKAAEEAVSAIGSKSKESQVVQVPNGTCSITNELLPEAKRQLIEHNHIQAQIKLQSKKTPVLHHSIGETWFSALKPEFSKPYFEQLSNFVVSERKKYTVYPPEENVWTWTKCAPIHDIKVVILGQDPYHGPGQAHGLCFSVQHGVPPPPSLVNIYKELSTDIPDFRSPNHGNLMNWANQGVLLLNACLTVKAGEANSHKDKGWEKLTDAVIKWLSDNLNGVVFLLWGAYAQKKAAVVDKKKHFLLHTVHPSPLSVYRGFFGCKHFSKCNEILEKNGKKPIDWSL